LFRDTARGILIFNVLVIFPMNIFLSFRQTGEDPAALSAFLAPLCAELQKDGDEVFCSLWLDDYFNQMNMPKAGRYEFCLHKLKQADVVIALQQNNETSEGMDMEKEKATKEDIPYILFYKDEATVHTHLKEGAKATHTYTSHTDLISQIKKQMKYLRESEHS